VLALLSSPVRRWVLTVLLVPVVAFVLSRLSRLLQRRNHGNHTRVSSALSSASDFLRRRTRKEDPAHVAS
jgi:hypothetical protein